VDVGVIVTDTHGHFVGSLGREDFHVFDNGSEQTITDFAAIDQPGQIVLLIEAGPAVYLLESSHLKAAYSLLNGLSSNDSVALIHYNNAPQTVLDFTVDKRAVASALQLLQFNLGFGSLNLSSSLSSVVDSLTHVPGKKTIVLLSTGIDTSPENESSLVLQKLKTSGIRLLAVSLVGELRASVSAGKKKSSMERPTPGQQEFAEADQWLRQLAEATGGRAYFPTNTKELRVIYEQISQLVRHEYSLAFAPPSRDGFTHLIEVRVSLPPARALKGSPVFRVDHRQAYLAPPSDKP